LKRRIRLSLTKRKLCKLIYCKSKNQQRLNKRELNKKKSSLLKKPKKKDKKNNARPKKKKKKPRKLPNTRKKLKNKNHLLILNHKIKKEKVEVRFYKRLQLLHLF